MTLADIIIAIGAIFAAFLMTCFIIMLGYSDGECPKNRFKRKEFGFFGKEIEVDGSHEWEYNFHNSRGAFYTYRVHFRCKHCGAGKVDNFVKEDEMIRNGWLENGREW